jgi:hypothetical protein
LRDLRLEVEEGFVSAGDDARSSDWVDGADSRGAAVGAGVASFAAGGGVLSAASAADSEAGVGDGSGVDRRKGAAASCAEATCAKANAAYATARTFERFLKRVADFLAAS